MQMYVQEEDYDILRISASSTMVVYVSSEVYSSRNGKECGLLLYWLKSKKIKVVGKWVGFWVVPQNRC